MQAIVNELTRLGISCEETEDGLIIHPKTPKCSDENPVVIQTYEDHRMAMAFAPAAIRFPSLTVLDAGVVSKSYPDYWRHLALAGFKMEVAK